jgi:transcriptional regulator with XRE-family HTH domain
VNTNLQRQLREKFSDKEYRDAYVAEYIYSRIPLKIRALREERNMSQAELGEKAGIAQPWVSKLEDPNYGRLTISTLLRVASAFDVGLFVDFVPFSEIVNRSSNLTSESFEVPSFTVENDFQLTALEKNEFAFESLTQVPDRFRNDVTPIDMSRAASASKGQPHPGPAQTEAEGGLAYAACGGSSR